MKKLLILSAMCLAMTAQATVLRVSNVPNSGAPYSTIPAALEVAVAGDTIMVDGSSTNYLISGGLQVTKRIVLMGPGYLLTQNGVLSNGNASATVESAVTFSDEAAGTIIQGMTLKSNVNIQTPNVVVTRCKIDGTVAISSGATNVVIHQNLISSRVGGTGSVNPANVQITNNIFTRELNSTGGVVHDITESRFAYNTFTSYASGTFVPIASFTSCTIENNIFLHPEQTISSCTMINNYWGESDSPYKNLTNDLEIKNVDTTAIADAVAGKGAFAGDDPYVISGIPAGPVIQDITVPASVEQGKTLNVTIKLGVQR